MQLASGAIRPIQHRSSVDSYMIFFTNNLATKELPYHSWASKPRRNTGCSVNALPRVHFLHTLSFGSTYLLHNFSSLWAHSLCLQLNSLNFFKFLYSKRAECVCTSGEGRRDRIPSSHCADSAQPDMGTWTVKSWPEPKPRIWHLTNRVT